MPQTDTDIEALKTLLPKAQGDYRALQHARDLDLPDLKPRQGGRRRLALVASVGLAVGALGLLTLLPAPQPAPTALSRFTAPGAFPHPPQADYARIARPSIPTARPTFSFALPQRPDGSRG